MERRDFLNLLGAGVVAAATSVLAAQFVPRLLGGTVSEEPAPLRPLGAGFNRLQIPPVMPTVIPPSFNAPTGIVRMRIPYGTIYGLPGTGNLMALTVDDGNSSAVVREHVAFAQQTGMRGAPYFRPPYGKHDARVDQLAAGIGYSTPVLWYGTLSDSGEITPEQLVSFADQWILPEHIVIGHANFPAVTQCFDHIAELIVTRKIQPATLDDLYTRV